jgi:GNAT superfamily N-acetyltransferase
MFRLRWNILRKPWGQPPGSEQDEQEEMACHRIVLLPGTGIIGTGRLQHTQQDTARIRYMAVHEGYRGMGIGQRILISLEDCARSSGARSIWLDARESALPFYLKQGYEPIRKSHVLFDSISHFEMHKVL